MESSAAVRARGLGKQFAPGAGVEGIELEIEPGTIFGFIGPSGSGKTTTIRLLTGVTAPDTGEVTVMGKSPAAFSREDRARIGYMPQLSVLYNQLTIWQNMTFAASIFGMPRGRRRRRIVEELEAVELTEATHRKLGKASGGMQRRVALAATLVHDPELLFLDEPTAGIDPSGRQLVRQVVADLRQAGAAVVVTTHDLEEAEKTADTVVIVDRGRVVASGTPVELLRSTGSAEIRFGAPPGIDTAALGKTLMAGVVEVAPGEYVIDLEPTPSNINALTSWLAAHDLPLADLRAGRQSLEDLFLRMTTITGELPAVRVDTSESPRPPT